MEDDYLDFGDDDNGGNHLDYEEILLKILKDKKELDGEEGDIQNAEQIKEITDNQSSISVTRMCNDSDESNQNNDCDYCKEANKKREEEHKTDGTFSMGGFSTQKFRLDDFERALDMGGCRSGDYIYFRNQRMSCCEVFSYRVKIGEIVLKN